VGVLSGNCGFEGIVRNSDCTDARASSVLLLIADIEPVEGGLPEASIILTKRSKVVKQPGDLCCPGGAIEKIDRFLSRLLSFRGSFLSRWPCWDKLKTGQPENAQFISLLYAAGLRESWEEMRLNPFGLTFLGQLPSQCLSFSGRVIHPLVAWVSRQKEFTLSSEVERIVRFPLHALLNPFNYAVYRMYVPLHLERRFGGTGVDFPCFIYNVNGRAELLWGATFRIVTLFLEMIFGFQVPDLQNLPLVPASVGDEYVNAGARNRAPQNNDH
jgi:8-oxo-dGTP pyrophosphatase MutT (NUDIX family)